MRTLGYRLSLPNTSLDYLINNKQTILSAIKDHGAICIPNANLKPKELLEFTKGVFDQIFVLPPSLAFKNQDNQHIQVSRVGNVLVDGTLKDASKEAIYYHSDGNYLGPRNNNLFNVMQSVEQPSEGGETLLIDLVKAVSFLKQKRPHVYNRLAQLKGVTQLTGIKDIYLYGSGDDVKERPQIFQACRYDPINKYNFNNNLVAYLSVHCFQDKNTGEIQNDIKPQDIVEDLHKEMGHYAHRYEHGAIFIWDNIQTLHRSAGPYKGRRLIYKCHGKQKSQRQNLMESIA